MTLIRNVLGLIFFALLGMFCAQLLTGHWWIFFIVVAVIGAASYVKRSVERKRRHERVRAEIQRRVEELRQESFGDERDNVDPSWGREIVDLDD